MTQKRPTTKKLDVKINQSIISILGRKLYESEFSMVILRELLQNCLDALAKEIKVFFDESEKTLTVIDDGIGILEIDGLLNIIGGVYKPDDVETIGGYGLAKLAIFGCQQWEFKSISGKFFTGFLFDKNDTIEKGTIVKCSFGEGDLRWNFIQQIKNYLMTIIRPNIRFYLNDEKVESFEYKNMMIGCQSEIFANTSQNGYAIIMVNGLPTFTRYISNLDDTVFFDYTVTADPYDEKYPLTSNRDSFIEGTIEQIDLKGRIDRLQKKLETDKKMEEAIYKEEKQTIFRGKKYISGGTITEEDYTECSATIAAFMRYVKQIGEDVYYRDMSNCNFGLTDGLHDELAMYSPNLSWFAISKHVENKGEILALAMHEFTHFLGYGMDGHDQSFSSKLTEITSRVLSNIFEGTFRK